MESIAFLSRSTTRVAVLSSLADGSKRLRDVADDVGGPRTTVRDNLQRLEKYDLIEEDLSRRYDLTTTGRLVFEAYQTCEREVTVIERLQPFLAHVSNAALPESIALFQDATIITQSRNDPYRVISTLIDILSDAQHIRAFMPTIPSPARDTLFDSSGATAQSLQLLIEETNDDLFPDRKDPDTDSHTTVRRTDKSLPFGLVIDDEQVTVYCLDSEMVARALVYTDDAALRRWATYTFYRHWDGGETHPPYTDRMSY